MTELQPTEDPFSRVLARVLALQCRNVGADGGAVLRPDGENGLAIIAVYPEPEGERTDADWIAPARDACLNTLTSGKAEIVPTSPPPPSGGTPEQHVIVTPIGEKDAIRAVAAFLMTGQTSGELYAIHQRLEDTTFLLDPAALQLTPTTRDRAIDRLNLALEVLSVVNQSDHFTSIAMALCNELADKLRCHRVSLGFLEGRYVRVHAMSRTDSFHREMKLTQDIEAAMEECLDQDLEIIWPGDPQTSYVSRAAKQLSQRHGPFAVLCMPIRRNGEVSAVMVLERASDRPFADLEEIETVRLACDLCAPRLFDLHCHDRWLGARLAAEAGDRLGRLLGPEHTWIKLSAGLAFVTLILLATVKGDYRINAAFTLEARHQQAVVAPFDSFSKEILVEPGDRVDGGQTLLGTLETAELRLKRAALMAEQLGYRKQMTAAMRDRQTAEAQIAQAQSDKVAAEIRLIEQKIDQATLRAPITGWVVSEDLKQKIGAPVKTGEILFEIASIDALRAELYVPESSIARVVTEQTGELASVGHPDQKVGFVVERINPIAEVIDHQNVFRVRARLDEHRDWMRPGMEGEAKIAAGRKSYLWIASHRLVDWLRLKLWF